MSIFWTNSMDHSMEKFQFFDFWTSCFYSLERCFFVLEYRKGHFPMLYCLKVGKRPIFGPKPWLNPMNINIFPNGWDHAFGPKVAIFPFFFLLGNIGHEKVFYDILERKNTCLGFKNQKFKLSKNWYFSKGVNPWFWTKNGHFCIFFFSAI